MGPQFRVGSGPSCRLSQRQSCGQRGITAQCMSNKRRQTIEALRMQCISKITTNPIWPGRSLKRQNGAFSLDTACPTKDISGSRRRSLSYMSQLRLIGAVYMSCYCPRLCDVCAVDTLRCQSLSTVGQLPVCGATAALGRHRDHLHR